MSLRSSRKLPDIPEDQRSTDQALLARLPRLDPVMSPAYHQVQAFGCMVRQRRSDAFDARTTAVQHTGVKELRAFVSRLLKDAAAVRVGLSLI
jgi:hypothetical protein